METTSTDSPKVQGASERYLTHLHDIQSSNREAMDTPADLVKAPTGITLDWDWIYTIEMINSAGDCDETDTARCFLAVIEYLAFGIDPFRFEDGGIAESVFRSLKPALSIERLRLEVIDELEAE